MIYFVIDYTPQRFNNRILNSIYHWLDQWCVKHSDETWNLNEKAMNDARKHFYDFNAYNYSRQKNTPMGFWKDRIKVKSFEEIQKKRLVFMGHLIKKQGVQFVLEAIPKIVQHIPDFEFLIIGGGEYAETLKSITKELGIENSVHFAGFVKNHKEVEEMIAASALAIAIYEKGKPETNFTYYTDQGKIKAYLGSGVPVILNNVPPISREIERNKAGVIIDEDKDSIAKAVIAIMQNEATLHQYKKNAIEYSKQFDWNKLFDTCFQ